jgi:serine/threonine protein kinase
VWVSVVVQALSIIGAGEYGEVYLAFQTVEGRTPEHKEISVTVPRAVKMMKSAATQQVKDEYCREAITMLKIGDHDNIVRLIGVAVQQAPWLMVLEFVQFGDLRAVLQACKENSIELSVGEMLSFMRQLAVRSPVICAAFHSCNNGGL